MNAIPKPLGSHQQPEALTVEVVTCPLDDGEVFGLFESTQQYVVLETLKMPPNSAKSGK